MRKFLFPLVAAAALALLPAAPSQAKANWVSDLSHAVQGQIYTYSYSPWWYGGYTYPTYSYYYTYPSFYYNYSYLPWYYGYGWPYRNYWYRPWYWGGRLGWRFR